MTEEKKVELRDEELEDVTGGVKLIPMARLGDGAGLYQVIAQGGLSLGERMIIIQLGGQEFQVKTDKGGYVHLPTLPGSMQVEFAKARIRLLDEAHKG